MFQRNQLGQPVHECGLVNDKYPRIKTAETFQHGYGYEKPIHIHGWDWSVTFGRWSALVTFADGWNGWTFPNPA